MNFNRKPEGKITIRINQGTHMDSTNQRHINRRYSSYVPVWADPEQTIHSESEYRHADQNPKEFWIYIKHIRSNKTSNYENYLDRYPCMIHAYETGKILIISLDDVPNTIEKIWNITFVIPRSWVNAIKAGTSY